MDSPLPRLFFTLLPLFICGGALAQNTVRKPDNVYKTDKTIVEVLIDEVNKTDIVYHKTNDPKGPLYAIPKKEVWKIIWNNGDVEEINVPASPQTKTKKPTDLIVRKQPADQKFWEKSGVYAGLRAAGGLSFMPKSAGLLSGSELAYGGGVVLGVHKKSIGIQVQPTYMQIEYGVSVPLGSVSEVNSIKGTQSQLLIPLTILASKKVGKMRIGVNLGAFGILQVGRGGLKVSDSANGSSTFKNCSTCAAEGLEYGVTGGLSITVLEGVSHAVFINADWYHNLGENKDYKPGENSVNTHIGLLSVGVLFHFPN
jgi:hypothetical protein